MSGFGATLRPKQCHFGRGVRPPPSGPVARCRLPVRGRVQLLLNSRRYQTVPSRSHVPRGLPSGRGTSLCSLIHWPLVGLAAACSLLLVAGLTVAAWVGSRPAEAAEEKPARPTPLPAEEESMPVATAPVLPPEGPAGWFDLLGKLASPIFPPPPPQG